MGTRNPLYIITYVCFQSHEIISKDEVIVEAESPSGRVVKLTGDGNYNAQFTPDEIGKKIIKQIYLFYFYSHLIAHLVLKMCNINFDEYRKK